MNQSEGVKATSDNKNGRLLTTFFLQKYSKDCYLLLNFHYEEGVGILMNFPKVHLMPSLIYFPQRALTRTVIIFTLYKKCVTKFISILQTQKTKNHEIFLFIFRSADTIVSNISSSSEQNTKIDSIRTQSV